MSSVLPEENTYENKKHRQLVEIAYKWVLKNTSCGVAFKELYTLANGEYPDVIGFGSGGHSVLVEVKVSRADFLKDQKKMFRKNPEMGMGRQRFYLCPTGLIKQEELPAGWGLVYVNDALKARCVYSPYKGNIGEHHNGFTQNIRAEHGLMYSVLRRLEIRNLVDQIYVPTPAMVEQSRREEESRKVFEKIEAERAARVKEILDRKGIALHELTNEKNKIDNEKASLQELSDACLIANYINSDSGRRDIKKAFKKVFGKNKKNKKVIA